MEKTRKAQKLDCFHHIFAKVVNAFVLLLCQEAVSKQDGTKLQPTVVKKKAPTSHLIKTLRTGTTA